MDKDWQNIAWNTISLSCPARWETIVTDETHLLFEENFNPVFELRWKEEKRHTRKSIDDTLCKIAEETGLLVQDVLPPHWKKLSKQYALKLLADNESREITAAIMICKECGTTLLLYFFDTPAAKQQWDLTRVIASINCHQQSDKDTYLWAIQDFKITLPTRFTLSGYNFGAGLTRISFTDSGLNMHLCRLAGASQRLQSSSMLTLMNLLGDLKIPEDDVQKMDTSVSHCSYPSIFQQVRSRIKREQPFHWVTLRHHPEEDRLSGLFFFDKKPISDTLVTTILDSYEICAL